MSLNLSIVDFYQILRNAVRFYPPTSPVLTCKQLQTFRVLQADPRMNSEIGTPNLGAIPSDRKTPFFWSRDWALSKSNPNSLSYSYPLLTAFEIVNTINSSSFGQPSGREYIIELAVLEALDPDCSKSNGEYCKGRSINQIFLNTQDLLDGVLYYVGQSVIATTVADPIEKVYFKPYLEAVVGSGNYTVIREIGLTMGGYNKSLRFERVEMPVKSLYGTKVRITFKAEKCPSIDFLTVLPTEKVIGFEVGCETC